MVLCTKSGVPPQLMFGFGQADIYLQLTTVRLSVRYHLPIVVLYTSQAVWSLQSPRDPLGDEGDKNFKNIPADPSPDRGENLNMLPSVYSLLKSPGLLATGSS